MMSALYTALLTATGARSAMEISPSVEQHVSTKQQPPPQRQGGRGCTSTMKQTSWWLRWRIAWSMYQSLVAEARRLMIFSSHFCLRSAERRVFPHRITT